MSDLAIWALVDSFTVDQAACLWVGAKPSQNPFLRTGVLKDQIAAIKQMLTGAILSGVLDVDTSSNPLRMIGDHSETVVTRETLRAFAESKNQRPDFLFDTLLPQKPNVIVHSPGPLVPLSEDDLDAYLRLDTWTLTQALFILSGNRPPGIESSSESMSHFPDAYHLAVNSIKSGTLCREITVAGERRFIESPTRWFSWAERKSLHVAEEVRAKMMLGESADEIQPAHIAKAPGLHWPQGTNSLEASDAPLLESMRQMLTEGTVASVWAAAGKVADQAVGGGTLDSKQKRLARRYKRLVTKTQST